MLSWQRISALVRRTNGPLFFLDESESDQPVVVLSLAAYETLLGQQEKQEVLNQEIVRIPVRFEPVKRFEENKKIREGGSDALAPDLLANDSPSFGPLEAASSFSSPAAPTESPAIMTPPASLTDDRSLEERFYFQSPVLDEYR